MEIKIEELRQMLSGSPTQQTPGPWKTGSNYLIRTVTMHLTGRLVEVYPQELVICDAAWIADSGRFSDCLQSGTYKEVEPFPDGEVVIGRGSIIDATRLSTPLPRSQK